MLAQVVFVQNSVHLAGAQKSLSRLLIAAEMQPHHPLLLTGQTGWLTEHCESHGVPWIHQPFPASRSLSGRLWKNRRFAKIAAQRLRTIVDPKRPLIVHTNDHPDSLLGQAVAQELGAVSIMTLRTPGMSQRDFEKYQCSNHRHLIAVGDQLYNKVSPWLDERCPLSLIHNGVTEDEILPPVSFAKQSPHQVLVLGSIIPRKGWQDLVEALILLEKKLSSAELPEIHFLGDLLGHHPEQTLGTHRLKRFKLQFLGTDPNYRNRLREYPLAIHPSRSESFGMAALECVAAGVPLLAAATGLIPEFIPQKNFLFQPQSPQELADKLEDLLSLTIQEITDGFDLPAAQRSIRERFSTLGTVKKLEAIYQQFFPAHP